LSELAGKLWGVVKRHRVLFGALLIVVIFLGGMMAYSGLWPPVFVVESASMQHSDTESKLGVIDTGDLVLIQGSDGGGVRTYVECYPDGGMSFGDYGDVIIYERYGRSDLTPIIHRAMFRLEYNSTSESFDIPSLADLPADKWGNGNVEDGRWWNLSGIVEIYDVGYKSAKLLVDLGSLLAYYEDRGLSHDGLITMGDHNIVYANGEYLGVYDQSSPTICREPITDEWIVGEAKIEIPWLGLIKLWVNGDMPSNTPENSKTSLVVVLAALIVVPLAIDISISALRKRGIDPWAMIKERFKRKKE
jgi:signal peptidase I